MLAYQSQINGKLTALQHELTQSGIENLCKAYDVQFIGRKSEEYWKGFIHAKTITYIFERKIR